MLPLQIEGKYTDKPTGTSSSSLLPSGQQMLEASAKPRERGKDHGKRRKRRIDPASIPLGRVQLSRILGPSSGWPLQFGMILIPPLHSNTLPLSSQHNKQSSSPSSALQPYAQLLIHYFPYPGLTLTQTWNTANALDTKLELADNLARGLKLEGLFNFLPATGNKGAKFNLHFKQPNFHGRAFFDLLKGPTANVDAVVGHEGFLAGASAGYDVNKAAVTAYSAAVGYAAPQYSAAVTASDNLSVFAASYYHKVNSQVEAGAKATWNSNTGNAVGLEVASKYRIDPVSFAKVCSSFASRKTL